MIVEKTDTGFSAYSERYPIYTTAGNIIDLMNNALEAVNLYFEEEGMQATHQSIRFEIDFKQFFQYYRIINAKFLAEKILVFQYSSLGQYRTINVFKLYFNQN